MKNSLFKYSTITIFVFICFLCSCKGKERPKYNNFGQIDLESLTCDSIKDITNAFPRIEKYHGYKLKQVGCFPDVRTYDLQYFTKDSISRMDITIRDIRIVGNDIFLLDAKQTFDNAEKNNSTKISSIKGEYATVRFNTQDSLDISSFICILKKNYAVNIKIYKNKNLTSQDSLESFLKNYVDKIDTSKLK